MIKFKKILAISIITIFITPSFAVDYSEMSTEELIVIIGYVKKQNKDKFEKELKSRVGTMNPDEKAKYKKNLEKSKKK
ncbi:MAG: DUF1104 domain-containing protein [Halarcobacter sp.]